MKLFIDKLKNHIYWLKISSGLYDGMDDETFLKMAYKRKFGKELDLNNPVTFNEKLQWLKLNDRKPEYTEMVDKFMAKKYVASIIGQEHIIPTLGVWSRFDDIDFEEDIVMVNGEYDWRSIEKRLIEMTQIQDKTFEAFPFPKKDIRNR